MCPQLDALRKEKDDYALFKSNENQIEESQKILTAFDFYENEKYQSTCEKKEAEARRDLV